MMKALVIAGVAALTLVGCSSDTTTPAAPVVTVTETAGATASPTESETEAEPVLTAESDAEDVITALREAGLPITDITIFTKATDPNEQMGQPGAYTSKGAFADERINPADVSDSDEGSIDLGGGVEVFTDNRRAVGRATYIEQAIISTGGLVSSENAIVAGGILLRLSGYLPAKDVEEYQATLAELTGEKAEWVVKA